MVSQTRDYQNSMNGNKYNAMNLKLPFYMGGVPQTMSHGVLQVRTKGMIFRQIASAICFICQCRQLQSLYLYHLFNNRFVFKLLASEVII